MADPVPLKPAATPTPTADPSDALVTGKTSALDAAIEAGGDPAAPKAPEPPKDGEPKPEAKAGAPEKYADFTLPEGITLEEGDLTSATALFKELGASQEQAQKLVDFHTKAVKAAGEAGNKLWQDTQKVWIDELNSDPTIGSGVRDGTVGASIAKMLSRLPVEQSAAFREAMNFTGAGNNPAIVRGLFAWSKLLAEPGAPVAGSPAGQAKGRPSAAEALYPTAKG